MKAKQGLIILAVLLVILLLLSTIWGYRKNKQNKVLEQQNVSLVGEIGDLDALKKDLEIEIDSLEQAYTVLVDENESLQGSLSEAEKKIASKDAALRSEKRNSAAATNNLRAEIQDLLSIRADLEQSIGSLQTENDSLRAVAGLLEQDLNLARSENQELNNLNQTIQGEVERLTLANFKASAFQVEVEKKKNTKVTSKSGKARRIKITFDLANVPEEYQGLKTLYIVISDDKGTPIKTENPIMTQVKVNGQTVELIAAEARDENIEESQRLSFVHELAEKLKAGYYRVAVYTDIGLLGASSFRLT